MTKVLMNHTMTELPDIYPVDCGDETVTLSAAYDMSQQEIDEINATTKAAIVPGAPLVICQLGSIITDPCSIQWRRMDPDAEKNAIDDTFQTMAGQFIAQHSPYLGYIHAMRVYRFNKVYVALALVGTQHPIPNHEAYEHWLRTAAAKLNE